MDPCPLYLRTRYDVIEGEEDYPEFHHVAQRHSDAWYGACLAHSSETGGRFVKIFGAFQFDPDFAETASGELRDIVYDYLFDWDDIVHHEALEIVQGDQRGLIS